MARVKLDQVAPREAAHQPRAASTRFEPHVEDHDAPRLRMRRRKATINENPYDIPLEEIPEGLTYEWKRWANVGEHDPFYIAAHREQGWEPVSPKRHPNWVPPGYNEPHIIKNGMILMDRPVELTDEFEREMRQMSRRQVRDAEQRLGAADPGTLDRVEPKIVKEYLRPTSMPIED